MPSTAEAQRFRVAQTGIRVIVERDLAAFWGSLNLNRPEAARDRLLRYVPDLVSTYGDSAAAVAADWYDEVRAAERVPGKFRAFMQPSPYQDATEPAVRRMAAALFTDHPDTMLTGLTATASKYVLAAGRETVTRSADRDPRASGWQRVTSGNACGFCRMLAGRGAVYKETSVNFGAHKSCNCAAVPSWDKHAPEVGVTEYTASQRMTALKERAAAGDAAAQRQLADHNALIQRAIETYAP